MSSAFDCTSLTSEVPSSNPSSQPSSAPTDSCVLCDGDVEYIHNPIQAGFKFHKVNARLMGCELASITSAPEQAAAMAAITNPTGSATEVWIGAELQDYNDPDYSYAWIDGPGDFSGAAVNGATTPYTNWLLVDQPDGGLEETALAMTNSETNPFGEWVDLKASLARSALYKCCMPAANNFAGCMVEPSFTGTVDQVIGWCKLLPLADRCCVPNLYYACAWEGVATIPIRSCNGDYACNFEASPTAISVGLNSCNGKFACQNIGSKATFIMIGDGSCTTINSCRNLGQLEATSVIIGDGSCTSGESCNPLGTEKATSIMIGNGSCTDYRSCWIFGEYNAISIMIGDGSCTGEYSCNKFARDAPAGIMIGDGSCTGENSCALLGSSSPTSIVVGDTSCTDPDACRNIGTSADSVTIKDSTCTASVCGNTDPDVICGGPSGGPFRYSALVGDVICEDCACLPPLP